MNGLSPIDPVLIAQVMGDDEAFEAIVSLRVAEERFQRCWDEAEAIARKYRAMPSARATHERSRKRLRHSVSVAIAENDNG